VEITKGAPSVTGETKKLIAIDVLFEKYETQGNVVKKSYEIKDHKYETQENVVMKSYP
jgi:hypothetical protein